MGQNALAHHDPRGTACLIGMDIFFVLSISAVALRFWSRKMKAVSLEFNDFSILIAMTFQVGLIAVITWGFFLGSGKWGNEISMRDLTVLAKLFLAGEPIWSLANSFTKFSILDLYIKIFRSKNFVRVCYITMGITSCYCAVVILSTFLLCRPFAFNWDKTIPNGHCANISKAFLFTGIINLLIDTFIVILPVRPLWQLQMAAFKKIQLTAIFCLGGLICVISILRIVSIQGLYNGDYIYNAGLVAIWSALEPSLGIISACLPSIQPAISKYQVTSIWRWRKSRHARRASQIVSNECLSNALSPRSLKADGRLQKFHRLRDIPINLTNIDDEAHLNEIGQISDSRSNDGEGFFGPRDIHIRQDWTLHTSRFDR